MASTYEPRGAMGVALMVTRRCNMACAHCSVESSSRIRQQPSEEELKNVVQQAADAGLSSILFTGGEPMLREALVIRLMTIARNFGISSALTTNGFWGKSLPAARKTLAAMRKAGLGFFTLSYDRYHAEFQGPGPATNILRAAEELKIPMNVNVTRVGDDADIANLLAPFEESRHARMRFYDVQSVGRARDIPPETLRGKLDGSCLAANVPAVTDDLRVTACNGPAYFQPATSSLSVGSLRDESLATLLKKHRDDPILQTIRLFGPSRLRAELAATPGFENFAWRKAYSGLCDLCLHINSDAAASAALRERLSDPRLTAERAARQLVIDGVAMRGEVGREFAHGSGAARVGMSGARGADRRNARAWRGEAARALGRADIDWRHMADYLAGCGLSDAILEIADDESIARWAPRMFREKLQASALRAARKELIQRRVLDAIDEELSKIGSRGVLLKGAAALALELSSPTRFGRHERQLPRRACGDIDIVVTNAKAANDLRKQLIARGATGHVDDMRSAPHHLAPVVLWGVPIEIHTSIMPSWWRLPESEMLENPVPCSKYKSLYSLGVEAMLVHAFMHSASHLFAYGLKTSWDVAWLVERFDDIDWTRVVAWTDRTAMSAGFYLPARVMKSDLQIPIPARLFARAPAGSRYSRLERVVGRRLFMAMEGTSDLNPISKHGFFLMLHNTWRGRALHLSSLFRRNEREARHANPHPRPVSEQLRESLSQLRQYRRIASPEMSGDSRSEQIFSDPSESETTTSAA